MSQTQSSWRTLPRFTPQWLSRRPELLVGWLRCMNLGRRHPVLASGAVLIFIALIWSLAQPWFAKFIDDAALDSWIVIVVMAAHTVTSIVRRKSRLHDGRAQSWLAPLPYRLSERSRLIALPAIEIVVLTLLLAIACAVGPLEIQTARIVVFSAITGVGIGVLASLLMARPSARKAADWRYAIVRQPRATWASAPRLHPLSFWAIAQGRAQFNPSVIARTVAPVLLAIPMGTSGGVVIAIVAGWAVALYLLSLTLAAIRTAYAATRWLRPTPITRLRLLAYVTYRTLAMQAITIALLALATSALRGGVGGLRK